MLRLLQLALLYAQRSQLLQLPYQCCVIPAQAREGPHQVADALPGELLGLLGPPQSRMCLAPWGSSTARGRQQQSWQAHVGQDGHGPVLLVLQGALVLLLCLGSSWSSQWVRWRLVAAVGSGRVLQCCVLPGLKQLQLLQPEPGLPPGVAPGGGPCSRPWQCCTGPGRCMS